MKKVHPTSNVRREVEHVLQDVDRYFSNVTEPLLQGQVTEFK